MVVIVVVIVAVVIMAAAIFVIPVALLHVPTISLMLVVRVIPVTSLVRRPLPDAGNPDVAASVDPPVAINPSIAFGGRWWTAFIANRRRRATTDHDADLRAGRRG